MAVGTFACSIVIKKVEPSANFYKTTSQVIDCFPDKNYAKLISNIFPHEICAQLIPATLAEHCLSNILSISNLIIQCQTVNVELHGNRDSF